MAPTPIAGRIVSTLCTHGLVSPREDAAALALVEAELARDREQANTLEARSCAVCDRAGETRSVGEAQCCAACAPILERALAEGGSLIRWVCSPVLVDSPPTCGRVYRVAYQDRRLSEIVADTDGACPSCRPAQRLHVEQRFGAIRWEEDAHA